MNLKSAQEFLTRCFAPEETIALLLRSEATAKVTQRIVTAKQAIAPRYLGWLAYENTNGANIYVAANPLRLGSRKRTKENIASVRHIYIDVDTDGDVRIATVKSSNLLPALTVILSTSPRKYQALWRIDGFDLVSQEDLLKHIAIAFGGDPACTDCNRVLRVPGYEGAERRGMGEQVHRQSGNRTAARDALRRDTRNFTIERLVEPLVLESEISGLADLHAYMKYQNYVTHFSFPYFDMPEIAKPFELRERPDDKLPYDPKNIRGGRPEASPAELKQEAEASAPPPEPQPNVPAAVQEIQQETVVCDDTSEQQSLTFKG